MKDNPILNIKEKWIIFVSELKIYLYDYYTDKIKSVDTYKNENNIIKYTNVEIIDH